MTRYLKHKDHHDIHAGKRIEGANEFCHIVESTNLLDPHK